MFTSLLLTPTLAAICAFSVAHPNSPPLSNPEPEKKEEKKVVAEVGEEAPAFELKDQQGKMHNLSDYKGKIVVLEWFNETCPYCKGVWDSGLVPKLITNLNEQDTDVVYLAINSTANRPEEEILESGSEYLEELKINIPMLMDYDGKVGHLYKARTTPHMYVIDTEGVLVYQGALSDDRKIAEGDKAETHVLRVVTQLEAGEEVSPSYVQPWGCPVKYNRDGNKSGRRGGRGKKPRG
jgi:peroxiredoxin